MTILKQKQNNHFEKFNDKELKICTLKIGLVVIFYR